MAHNNQDNFSELSGHLSHSLEGLTFPAHKSSIISFARSHQIDSNTLSIIEDLPDRQYEDLREVLDHFTGGTSRVPTKDEQNTETSPNTTNLTGLRQGKPAPQDSGSRNVRDIPDEHS